MRPFEVGDEVVHPEYGEGVVNHVDHVPGDDYPVAVKFNDTDETFSIDGREYLSEEPTLRHRPTHARLVIQVQGGVIQGVFSDLPTKVKVMIMDYDVDEETDPDGQYRGDNYSAFREAVQVLPELVDVVFKP